MTPPSVALLLGLFGVPCMLMVLGHRLRGRTESHKRRFWGGALGYFLGVVIAVSAMLAPPVWWPEESFLRPLLVHWPMLFGGVVGMLTGPLWARTPGKGRRHTP